MGVHSVTHAAEGLGRAGPELITLRFLGSDLTHLYGRRRRVGVNVAVAVAVGVNVAVAAGVGLALTVPMLLLPLIGRNCQGKHLLIS